MEKLHAEQGIHLGMWADSEFARSEWGKAGGGIKSAAKAKASRENGKKGGRPRKPKEAHELAVN